MSYRSRIFLTLAALLLASATLALGSDDPELTQCQHQCRAQTAADERQVRECIQRCEDYDRRKHGGHGGVNTDLNERSPIERLRDCNRRCEQHPQGERREGCQRLCQQEYEREREPYEEGTGDRKPYDERTGHRSRQGSSEYQDCRRDCQRGPRSEKESCEEGCDRTYHHGRGGGENGPEETSEGEARRGWSFSSNPYVFQEQHFVTGMRSEFGRLRILQKFADRSELLRGIENFRLAIFETQPQTFVVPNHWDADNLIFVANGRGALSLIHQEKTEILNIKEGDIIRIRAGTTSYCVNRDNRESLVLLMLYEPVNTPGDFEVFLGAGGENRDSFLTAFSNEILEAAFNVRSDRIRRLFGQQRQGAIVRASPEQLRGVCRGGGGGSIWPFGGESKDSYNLYDRRPNFSNQFGRYYEVDANQFRQLQDMDVIVSVANISQAGMMAPYYNSKATEINVVVNGEGYFEMACPHLARSQSRKPGYETVRSRLSVGTVVIVPAGHPFVAVASNNRNLQIVSFKVNAKDNKEFNLAGRKNVMNAIEREAKQLAFGMAAREVEEVFGSQPEEFFFRGPRQGGPRSQE